MVGYTRRSHIVRVPMDATAPAQGQQPSTYADVEVLDAIAFRVEGNKEVILQMDQTKAVPYIVDNTGGGHGTQPEQPTQRTHMQRVKSKSDPTQMLDVEVMDCVAFRDQRGEEWLLDMQNGSGDTANVYDISDNSGDPRSTRRVHDETVSVPFGKTKANAGTNYLTIQRNDNIAFRKLRGEEVIIVCPSCDDPKSPNVNFGRASTYVVTPQGYDPNNNDSGPTPPLLAASGDKHVYIAPVKGASGFMTGDAKIAQGPFWWVRKVQAGSDLMCISMRTSSVAVPDNTVSFYFDAWAYDASSYSVYDPALAATINPKGTKIPIANPITAAMIGSEYMFLPKAPFERVTPNSWYDLKWSQIDTYRQIIFNISAIKSQLPKGATTLTISARSPRPTGKLTGTPVVVDIGSNVIATSSQDAIAEYIAQASTRESFGGVYNNQIFATNSPNGPYPNSWTITGKEYLIPIIHQSFLWEASGYTIKAKDFNAKQPIQYTNGYPDFGGLNEDAPGDQINGARAPWDKYASVSAQTTWSSPPFPKQVTSTQDIQPDDFSWTIDLTTLKFIDPAELSPGGTWYPNNAQYPAPPTS